ncbi:MULTISPECIES: ABC transporter ATP-binding protein [unclassified Arthrobacter]|uniref:ABC transporter ATP-binding protein n=1 Tax=unclassified Arthrobacter TaxID=235627 RepID=UPI0024DFC260|nr:MULTISPECIES: ABC transporter ATP-binding protein [unclassified Arthrobacter]MCC9144548.1 ABC transporter ATP-binding protein [Arthrobacter sp. zg-Y919]MDK1275774.1 ABC transporter ATP-binding protein [Arthrobacter sp. zg.Y919]WIB02861.1 ABC transporter ATP-binding protein [Arthrobacter sp. zg-Y919]
MTAETAISVRGLTKRFGRVTAVDDLSFEVQSGSVFAFLGANGAGKSTTISCLTTVLPPDAGTVTVAGHDVGSSGNGVREAIGVVFQDSLLDPILTGRENLQTRARFYSPDKAANNARINELGRMIGLGDFLDRRYATYSGGERRRVDIARALLHSPSIIFLDEPTAGLDPASRAVVWSTIHDLRENHGLTVFLTTHYMEETEEADRVCVIEKGRIIADGTPTTLRAEYSSSILSITSADPQALAGLADDAGVAVVGSDRNVLRLRVDRSDTARRLLAAHGDSVLDFEFRHGTMDDVFLALTGRQGEAA